MYQLHNIIYGGKKLMKRLLISVLALLMVIAFAACSSGVSQEEYDALADELEELKDDFEDQADALEAANELLEEAQAASDDAAEPQQDDDAVAVEVIADEPVADKAAVSDFDADEIISQLESTEYILHTDYSHKAYLVVKNPSSFVLKMEITATFYDDEGNIIGTTTEDQFAFEPGYELAFEFYNEDDFATVEYSYWVEEDDWYKPVLSSLAMEVSTTDDKAIISVTNNGEVPAEFVHFTALFMKDDELVYADTGFCSDGNNEIAPGKMQRGEAQSREKFDSVLIYLSGLAD